MTCVAEFHIPGNGVEPATYGEFWHQYLREHADRRTRIAHYIGTSFALVAAFMFAATGHWGWLIAMPVVAYVFAWASHGLIEGNFPLTFSHPLWSLASDFRMFFLALTGRLKPHLRSANKR